MIFYPVFYRPYQVVFNWEIAQQKPLLTYKKILRGESTRKELLKNNLVYKENL